MTDPAGKQQRFDVVKNWITTFTAVAALALSTLTFIQLNRTPDVQLTMPNMVRMSQNSRGYLSIFVQPTFTASRKTERPAILPSTTLLVLPQVPDKEMPEFQWTENVRMEQLDNGAYVRKMVSDPSPILIFGDPVSPMFYFRSALPAPKLQVGRLQMTLSVEWQGEPAMVNDFCLELNQEAFAELTRPEELGDMQLFTRYGSTGCYLIVP